MKKASAITLEARSLLILGLPLVGSQVAQFAVHTTDTLMLGWYSVLALAQVTLGAQVCFIAFIATSGFAFAILPMVAKSVAEDDWQSARRATRMGLWVSTLAAALLFLPMWYARPLLEAMGQDPVVAQGAQRLSAHRRVWPMARIVGTGAAQLSFGAGTCRDRALGVALCFSGQCADQLRVNIWELGLAGVGAARRGDCFCHIPNARAAWIRDLHSTQFSRTTDVRPLLAF